MRNLSCWEAIIERRSTRKFKDSVITTEDLDMIIEAARLAPSGTNRQPWRFLLLSSKEEKEKIAGAVVQPFVLEAPAVFVCCLDRRAYTRVHLEERMHELVQAEVFTAEAAGYITQMRVPGKVEEVKIPSSAYIDLGIAVQNMVLMATTLGLGSCWVRLFNPQKVHDAFKLSAEIEVVALLPIGYPAQLPPSRPRLSRDQIMLTPGE